MISYAKISEMKKYQEALVWPILTEKHNVYRYGTRGWEYPWVFEQLKDIADGSHILDGGCGTTDYLAQLHSRGVQVTGLDFFVDEDDENAGYGLRPSYMEKMADKAMFLNGSLDNIPAPDNSFDVVTCISVMEHIVIYHRDDPQFHNRCLNEMKRVLKPGGTLICTYDTVLNHKVMFGDRDVWGNNGWYYLDDIDYLDMELKDPSATRYTYDAILADEDTFFIPPDLYLEMGYGSGFDLYKDYHRLTSIGFVLVKK